MGARASLRVEDGIERSARVLARTLRRGWPAGIPWEKAVEAHPKLLFGRALSEVWRLVDWAERFVEGMHRFRPTRRSAGHWSSMAILGPMPLTRIGHSLMRA